MTSPTQRTLLSVLASAAPSSVPFHRLIDAVWEQPPPSAENSLHSHLTRLRKILGAGSIVREGGAYRLCSPTDADRFVGLLADPASTSPGDRRARLTEALSLWRGPPFGQQGQHPFVQAAARALQVRYAGAQRELARLDLDAGHPTDTIARLRRLLDAHPLDEGSWALLVEALAAGGHRCRERPRATLDQSPGVSDGVGRRFRRGR